MKQAGRNRWGVICGLLFIISQSIACGKAPKTDSANEITYQLYYLNKDETKVVSENYETTVGPVEEKIEELIGQLSELPKSINEKNPITQDVVVSSYEYSNFMLTIDFAPTYYKLKPITEVLTRAAIVRTLIQIEDVNYIVFRVNGEMLLDDTGNPIGTMTASTFIDNAGVEINSYETVKMTLFFASDEGTSLVRTARTVDFNTNFSLERMVVEQLIAGPEITEASPVINPATKVVNVTTIDGVCYVNLDNSFLTQTYSVSPEVVIYSIANSLVELTDINKVQIMVNGETDILFRDTMSLKNFYERNLDIIE